jgi:sugar-phosphatase
MQLAVKGLLFDNDGVLVSSLNTVEEAWGKWSEKYAPGFAIGYSFHGRPAREIVAELVSQELFEVANAEINDLEVQLAHRTKPMPGAIQLVSSLDENCWAVVTGAHHELGYARLMAAGIPEPKVLVTVDDVQRGKPDPESYVLASQRLGIDISECLVFEDAPSGVMAGRTAGAKYVVGVGSEVLESEADLVISSLMGITFIDGELSIPKQNRLR